MTDRRLLTLTSALLMTSVAVGCARESVDPSVAEERTPVEARAAVDRAVATTGDLITYSIVIEHDPSYEIEVSEAGAEIAGFRITDVGQEETTQRNGYVVFEKWYELRADLVGSYVLPPLAVRYRPVMDLDSGADMPWESLTTSEIFVEVESVLPTDTAATDIRDLKPVQKRSEKIPWIWIGVGIAIAVLVAAGVLIWLRRRGAREEEVIPPHELAFEALDGLRQVDFSDPGEVRRFYFSISEVLRRYVEGRFSFNATDLTTEEILDGLPELADLEKANHDVFGRFLVSTDQVKFAHHEPSQQEIEQTYETALSFVEATRPVEVVSMEKAA